MPVSLEVLLGHRDGTYDERIPVALVGGLVAGRRGESERRSAAGRVRLATHRAHAARTCATRAERVGSAGARPKRGARRALDVRRKDLVLIADDGVEDEILVPEVVEQVLCTVVFH